MKDKIINFKTAKLAKDKGFNIHCIECYTFDGKPTLDIDGRLEENNKMYAPTQTLLQKWLREKHKIVIYIQPKMHLYYEWHIITTNNHIISSERSYDWEELLESALYESLKLIDNNL